MPSAPAQEITPSFNRVYLLFYMIDYLLQSPITDHQSSITDH